MDTLHEFITEYIGSTDWPVALLQVVLFAGAVGGLGAGLLHRVSGRSETNQASIGAIGRLSATVASLAPLVGILGTVLGARGLIPAISDGRLNAVSSDLGIGIGTTAVGIVTALVAIVAAELLRVPKEASHEP